MNAIKPGLLVCSLLLPAVLAVAPAQTTAYQTIAWYGPIVMNTQAQLAQAFEELREGTFLKKGD